MAIFKMYIYCWNEIKRPMLMQEHFILSDWFVFVMVVEQGTKMIKTGNKVTDQNMNATTADKAKYQLIVICP